MSKELPNHRLADRTEHILRSDRKALRYRHRPDADPALLLALVPDNPAIIDLMKAYLPAIADAAGLQFVCAVGADLRELPAACLDRLFLVVADLTGRDEGVITRLYPLLGRRVLIATQSPDDVPQDLRDLPAVVYGLQPGQFDDLLRAVEDRTVSTLNDRIKL